MNPDPPKRPTTRKPRFSGACSLMTHATARTVARYLFAQGICLWLLQYVLSLAHYPANGQ